LENNSVDFIFLCQAFHHADDPEKLIYEIRRVLKPDGIVIIIGEHIKIFKVDSLRQNIWKFQK